jgi:hypothetical protein
MDVQGVFLSTISSMEVQGVFPPPVVWKCRVSLHHKQYGRAGCFSVNYKQHGRAGCLSTTNSMDVQGVFLLPAIRTSRVYAFQPASSQLCNRRKNNVDGGTSSVPETQSGTRIRGPVHAVPECSGTRLRFQMPECRCRRHQP